MTNIEKVKHIREITLSPMNKINNALLAANGNVSEAIAILIKEKSADAIDMANRKADNAIVYSYVHNNKIGAMIVLASQTDFVAKNKLFLNLAKDICMHIVSNPSQAYFIDYDADDSETKILVRNWYVDWSPEFKNKPQNIADKIFAGKLDKKLNDICLLRQKFIKDDAKTIKQLIDETSATLGEKIELKKFMRYSV